VTSRRRCWHLLHARTRRSAWLPRRQGAGGRGRTSGTSPGSKTESQRQGVPRTAFLSCLAFACLEFCTLGMRERGSNYFPARDAWRTTQPGHVWQLGLRTVARVGGSVRMRLSQACSMLQRPAGGGSWGRVLATQILCHTCLDQLSRIGAEATIFTTSLSCMRRLPAPLSSHIQKDEPSGIHSSMTPLPMWWPWLINSTWLPSGMNSNAAFIDSGSWLPVMGKGSLSRTIPASLRRGHRRSLPR